MHTSDVPFGLFLPRRLMMLARTLLTIFVRGCNLGNNPLNNFKEAFQDGLVLCALIHKADPKLIDYKQLSPSNKEANIRLAFSILEKNFNLPNVRILSPAAHSSVGFYSMT